MKKSLPISAQLVPISDAAEILGVSIDTVRRWEKAGKISCTRPDGKNRLFSVEELERMKQEKPLTISQVSTKLGLSQSTLRRLEERGIITPSRNKNGERRYDKKCIADFLASDYFNSNKSKFPLARELSEESVQEPAAEKTVVAETSQKPVVQDTPPVASTTSKPKKGLFKNTDLLVLRSAYTTNFKHLERLEAFRRRFYEAGSVLVIGFIMLVFVITVSFLIFPEDTAEFFGYYYLDDEQLAARTVRPDVSTAYTPVLGATTIDPPPPPEGEVLGKSLKPFSKLSLLFVEQIDEETYQRIVERLGEEDLFSFTEEGVLVPNYPLRTPEPTYIELTSSEEVVDLNAELVQGRKPGTAAGDLAVYGDDGTIPGVRVTADSLLQGSITSELLNDGGVQTIDLAEGCGDLTHHCRWQCHGRRPC